MFTDEQPSPPTERLQYYLTAQASSSDTAAVHQALKNQTKHTIELSLPESVFGKVK